jgi:WD40 repeat protein
VARLFISHSTTNNAAAIALRRWLAEQGFDDVFVEIDPDRGVVPGERWQEALKAAAHRCEAVLCLLSPAWLDSTWCKSEFLLAKLLDKRIFGLIVEPVAFKQVPIEMAAEWQLCELVGEGRCRTFEVEVFGKPAGVAFREAGLDLLRRGLDRAGLDARSFPWPPRDEPTRAPYRGLKALEAQDAAIFFGRDAAIVRGLDRIRGLAERGVEKLLVVLGASGSGKSSFLRAGLWPRLARDDATFLPLPMIRPQTAAIGGSTGLAAALAAAFERLGAPRPPGRIKEALAEGTDAFGRLLDDLLALAKRRLVTIDEGQADPAIVLPLDQAEELFNPDGAAEAAAFLDLLSDVLMPAEGRPSRRLLVVATMRSDRYELLQAEPHLAAVSQDPFNLPPIPQAEFKNVIEGPARRVVEAGGRLTIDPALTEKLIADAQGADALPLLGFTLERLYADYGGGGRLSVAEYEKLGGVQGSIEAAAANALAEPGRSRAIPAQKEAQLAALRAAFIPWLARIDPETGAPMRRVARLDEIPDGSRAIVERLVDARLLVADRRAGTDVIEAAHESLLRQWPALTAWLDTDAADLKLVEAVERAAGEWVRNDRFEAWLDHRGDRLRAAERLVMRDDFRKRLGEEGATYLVACRAREEAERQAREEALAREQTRLAEIAAAQVRTARLQRRFTRGLTAFAAFVVIVAIGLGLGVWQLTARQRALDEGHINLLAELAAGEQLRGDADAALRLAVHGTLLGLALDQQATSTSKAGAELAAAVSQSRWRLVLSGHELPVVSAAFSPDGSRIVTASADTTARLWDAQTGTEIAVLRGHASILPSAAFSPDGSRIVTASVDKTARIWDASTGKQIAVLRGHENQVLSAAFSPDGSRIVTASDDKTARIWDAATAKEIAVLRGHEGSVESAAFSPDGSRIVTASSDQTARVWDAQTATEIAVLRGHDGEVTSATFSPDGSRIVTAFQERTARIWDAATATEIAVLRGHENIVRSAAFSPDGSRIVTASVDKTARVWDATTAKEIAVLRGHENFVYSAAFSPDGSRIVTASWDGTARIWDGATGNQIKVLPGHENYVVSAAFSPDGSRIVTASADRTARIWDAATATEIAALRGHEGEVYSAAYSPDGLRIVTASEDKTARIWDAATATEIAVLRGHQGLVSSAAFSPDGLRIVTASHDGTARIWNAATATEIAALQHDALLSSTAFSPDGSRIVTSTGETARIWDAATAKEIKVLRGHGNAVRAAAFSPNGLLIVTSSWDQTARIWDAATGDEIAVLRGHEGFVQSAVFSPDGSRIVTASWDYTARIWDAATAKEIAVLRGHEREVISAAFSRDGSRIVTASEDNTTRIWDVRFATMPTKGLLAEVCTRRLGPLTKLTRDEMRLAGYPDSMSEIDVCADLE